MNAALPPEPNSRRRPRFYFSFRSPYSWLAYRDLCGTYADQTRQLEWRPFWEPDDRSLRMLTAAGGKFIYTQMSKEKHRYMLLDVRRLAAQRGLRPAWPVDRNPCWEVPHLAYLVARQHDRGAEFIDRVYRARWQEGLDICDRTTIARIGTAIGLADIGIADAADDPDVRAEGVLALLDIYRDGIFGVPFFVNGHDKFWGVDRLPTFMASLAVGLVGQGTAGSPRIQAPAMSPANVDDGHAGGCG